MAKKGFPVTREVWVGSYVQMMYDGSLAKADMFEEVYNYIPKTEDIFAKDWIVYEL